MLRKLTVVAAAVAFSTVAFAEEAAMDMSKMGPMTRTVTKKDDKGVEALYAAVEDATKKADVNAAADHHDFPIAMSTDDATGMFQTSMYTREMWVNEMKPWFANMPKDMKMSMKRKIHWHSDTLATVIEDHSMTMGKVKGSWVTTSTVVKKGDKWMFKSMMEAGWGRPQSMEKNAAAPQPTKAATK